MRTFKNEAWSLDKAREFYRIPIWSEGYFDINSDGHMVAKLGTEDEIDLTRVSAQLHELGVSCPVLIRFPQLLKNRIRELDLAFQSAVTQQGCNTTHTTLYPIKVNQQGVVIENILNNGFTSVGLEVGSKTELLAALSLFSRDEGLLVCNGYKDRSYIRLALYAQMMGIKVFLVIEKLSELAIIERECTQLNVTPILGVRIRLNSIASGNWQNTGGPHAKFGLSVHDLLQLIQQLKTNEKGDWLQLLHFHMGSQISGLKDFTQGLSEALRIYAELYVQGITLEYLDLGGGLAVDYAGQNDQGYFSKSYSIQEYAQAIIATITRFCEKENLPVPQLFTENGRALTAHHAVLITNVVDVDTRISRQCGQNTFDCYNKRLREMADVIREKIQSENFCYSEELKTFRQGINEEFISGRITLSERAKAECFLQHLLSVYESRYPTTPENELTTANKYYCNLSIFQSMPDVWGLKQIFPIVPLARLHEEPTEEARVHDLTCDSDGQIPSYIDTTRVNSSIRLHPVEGNTQYELGFFLLGAYQEILGDIHNLFGDTHTANVEYDEQGGIRLTELEIGDCADELLRSVHINSEHVLSLCEQRFSDHTLSDKTRRQAVNEIQDALFSYTYLDSIDRVTHRIKG